jgi:hypothetical protein
MGLGYMGYVKLGGAITLATNSSIQEVITPIYSNSVHGAGWKDAGSAYYADDVIRHEGNVDFELIDDVMAFLTDWSADNRVTPQTIVVSPDGSKVYTYTAGVLSGAWNSSIGFSTSEGSMITCSCGVLALTRVESAGTSYILNDEGLAEYPEYLPYPYWKSIVSLTANSGPMFGANTAAIEWSIDVSQNPVVVYGCTGTMGPIALMMGEMEASASITMFNMAGVEYIPVGSKASNTKLEISIDGAAHKFTLPAAVFESDGNDLSGGDSVVTRAFSLKGLSSKGTGVLAPFTIE